MASDVVSLIEQDHRELEALFEAVVGGNGNRRALLDEITARLVAHARAEELEVYPVLARAKPAEEPEVQHAEHEHYEAEHLLRKARNLVDTAHFDEAFTAFVDAVRHHVEEEESDVLPELRASVDEAARQQMGVAFEEARLGMLDPSASASPASALLTPASQAPASGATRDELYEQAKEADIPGRSRMTKDELAEALEERPG